MLLSQNTFEKELTEFIVYRNICFTGFVFFLFLCSIRFFYQNIDLTTYIYLGFALSYFLLIIIQSNYKIKWITKQWLLIIISFLVINTGYIAGGGILSPVIYLIFPLLLGVINQKSHKNINKFIIIIILNFIVLFIINYYYPNFSNTNNQQFVFFEKLGSHLISLVFTFIIVNIIFNSYQSDKQNAENSLKTKEAFLANMSHIIRTPLNGINGYADLLLDSDIPDIEKNEFKARILNNSKELHHIIFNLIDLSIIEEKSLQLRAEKFILYDFIHSLKLKAEAEILHFEKQIKLEVNFDDTIKNLEVNIDVERFHQLLWNYIKNSIENTSSGFLRILFKFEKASDYLSITIEDSGCGIDEKELHDILNQEIFDRNQSVVTNPKPGMGMRISKGLLNYFGGKMDLSSSKNQGTFIELNIPLKGQYEFI